MKTTKHLAEKLEKCIRYCSTEVKVETIEEFIERYAKEQAVGFLEWVVDNNDGPILVGKNPEDYSYLEALSFEKLFGKYKNRSRKKPNL